MTSSLLVEQKDRTTIVDIIRGFALFGVLIANFTSFVDQQTPKLISDSITSDTDKFLINFNTVFHEWKFMTLFSILFGYGFGLIIESLERKNINPNFFFGKRMFWLLVFGVVHSIFWWGDILNLYAISGILLLLFKNKSNLSILFYSILFMFIIPVLISYLLRNQPEVFTNKDIQGLFNQYKTGTIIEIFKFNVNFYYRMFIVSGINLYDIIETLGRFLFGFFLLRLKFFQSIETKKTIFRKIALVTFPLMVVYFICQWILINGNTDLNQHILTPLLSLGVLSTTAFYVSTLVIAYITLGMNKIFGALQVLGRMTLTNYLMISVFLIILLYGFGFNKLGEISIHEIWLFAIIWLFVEIMISTYWLKNYRYGPVEWIWRQLTYWKRLQLRR